MNVSFCKLFSIHDHTSLDSHVQWTQSWQDLDRLTVRTGFLYSCEPPWHTQWHELYSINPFKNNTEIHKSRYKTLYPLIEMRNKLVTGWHSLITLQLLMAKVGIVLHKQDISSLNNSIQLKNPDIIIRMHHLVIGNRERDSCWL